MYKLLLIYYGGKVLDSKAYWLGINIFIVAAMVIIGGITRITNSGLSMTEWNLIGGIIHQTSGLEYTF